ncbi:unnamed protein product [Leptidea sinapis]|uniref:Uncharacterized protein n=1 Tax=Leptidea sinapis TaxID=189913 RepID=A0A5E4QX32_9NEOP|nr:unnamed protein product [Leptidea sinapis]
MHVAGAARHPPYNIISSKKLTVATHQQASIAQLGLFLQHQRHQPGRRPGGLQAHRQPALPRINEACPVMRVTTEPRLKLRATSMSSGLDYKQSKMTALHSNSVVDGQ